MCHGISSQGQGSAPGRASDYHAPNTSLLSTPSSKTNNTCTHLHGIGSQEQGSAPACAADDRAPKHTHSIHISCSKPNTNSCTHLHSISSQRQGCAPACAADDHAPKHAIHKTAGSAANVNVDGLMSMEAVLEPHAESCLQQPGALLHKGWGGHGGKFVFKGLSAAAEHAVASEMVRADRKVISRGAVCSSEAFCCARGGTGTEESLFARGCLQQRSILLHDEWGWHKGEVGFKGLAAAAVHAVA